MRFFAEKGYAASFAWQDLVDANHGRYFTVAKAMQMSVLEAIREAVDRAIADGITLEQFIAELRPRLEELGWWGRQTMLDPADGQFKSVQLGSPRRLRIIFDVNLRSAYAAGRWKTATERKSERPYLRYVAILDKRTRPEHAAWHGTIKPVDDPWWEQHFPPCGWNCRCITVPVDERTMRRRGWTVSEDPPSPPDRQWRNPRTGVVTTVAGGIDPGFGFNIGKAWLGPLAPRAIGGNGLALNAEQLGPDASGFMAAFGLSAEEEAVFLDRAGWPIVISAEMFRDAGGELVTLANARSLSLAAAAIQRPAEIRAVWRSGADGRQMLFRRYLALVDGVGVVVDIGNHGWIFATTADEPLQLGELRTGVVLWSPDAIALASRRKGRRLGVPRAPRPTGFRPDQSRIPKGQPGAGQWRTEAVVLDGFSSSRQFIARAKGGAPNRERHIFGRVERADRDDLHGRELWIKADDARHIRIRHGLASADRSPLRDDEFDHLPLLVTRGRAKPDGTHLNHRVFMVTHEIDGHRYTAKLAVYESEKTGRRQGLAVFSYFKRPL